MNRVQQGITLFAAFVIHVLTHGILYSFGVIFIALEEKYGGNKTEIVWIGSISTSMLYLTGPVAGYLTARFGCRRVAMAGSLIGFLGYGVSLFVDSLYLLYVTMGLIAGSGFGLLFLPAVVAVTQAFHRYRAVAVGLSLCGAGTGAFVFSPLQKWLLDTYAWQGTLLLNAAVLFNGLPFALLLLQDDTDHKETSAPKNRVSDGLNEKLVETTQTFVEESDDVHVSQAQFGDTRTKHKFAYDSDQHACVHYTSDTNETYRQTSDNTTETEAEKYRDKQLNVVNVQYRNESNYSYCATEPANINHEPQADLLLKENLLSIDEDNTDIAIEEHTVRVKKKSFIESIAILSDPIFVLFTISQFLFFFGLYLPFMFILDRARQLGIEEETSVWIVSAIGISSIVSRVVLGYIVDRLSINRARFMTITLLLGGLASAFVPLFVAAWMMFVYAAVYGICIGVTLSFISVVLADLLGIDKINEAFGMNNLFTGVAVLLGPPFAGFLYDATGNYNATFIVTGSLQVLACAPMVFALFINKR